VAFFGLLYLYVWQWVDPSLLYHGAKAPTFPAFSSSLKFLKSFLVLPGGPAQYLAALLSQLYYYSWSGALTVTATAVLLGWAVSHLIAAIVGSRVPMMWCFPALVILALSSQYMHGLALLAGVLVAVWMACTYVRTSGLSPAVRLATFLILRRSRRRFLARIVIATLGLEMWLSVILISVLARTGQQV